MGIYGVDMYGGTAPPTGGLPTYYGPTLGVINTYSTGPLTVLAGFMGQFNQVAVTWGRPTTGVDVRLVRNTSDIPDNENDGTVLYVGPASGSASYIDTVDSSASGKFLYYSIFVSDSSGNWHRGGDGIGLLPADFGYCDHLYDLLPQFYRTRDLSLLDPGKPSITEGPLQRFLCLIGFAFSFLRTEYETLRLVNDPAHCSGGLLPLLAQQLGVRYEIGMGMRQNRKLLENIIHLYKIKGTSSGIEGITAAVTGWGTSVGIGTNQMLDPQDTTFHCSSTGVSTEAVTQLPPASTDPLFAMPHPSGYPITLSVSSGNYPTAAYWLPASTATTTFSWSSLNNLGASAYGIHVKPGEVRSFSIYVWPAEAHTITPSLRFYDQFGTVLSTVAGSPVTTPVTVWTRVTQNNVTVPANAVWAEALLVTGEVVTDTHPIYLSLPQFEIATAATAYQPPRDVRITLLADRVNRVVNPSMEASGSTTSWNAGTNTTLGSRAGGYSPPAPSPSGIAAAYSGTATSIAAGAIGVYTDFMSASEEELYVASAAVEAVATPQLVTISMIFCDVSSSPIMTVISTAVMDTVGSYTPISVAMDPRHPTPLGTVKAYISIQWSNTGAVGEVHAFDTVLFEQSLSVQPYFDASPSTATPANNDYVWGSVANLSESFFYRNRTIRMSRLAHFLSGIDPILPGQTTPSFENGFIPAGMTYTLLTAQPV